MVASFPRVSDRGTKRRARAPRRQWRCRHPASMNPGTRTPPKTSVERGRTSPGAGDFAAPGPERFRFLRIDGSNPEPRRAPTVGASVPRSRLEAVIGRSRRAWDEGFGALGTFQPLPATAWKRSRVSGAPSVPGSAEGPSESSLTGIPRRGRQRMAECRETGFRAWRRRDRDAIGRGLHGDGGSHGTGS